MGALTMSNNPDMIKGYLKDHDTVRECASCPGVMIPKAKTLKKKYNGITLTIKNIPVFECLNCEEINYGTGSLSEAIRGAKRQYDTSGDVVYNYK